MFVKERFKLKTSTISQLRAMKPEFGYGLYGEIIFFLRYSRVKEDGSNENWADVVIRCIEGTMSIRKDWYLKTNIFWDEEYWQEYAKEMALSLFNMEWCPPGRGLWMMGTEFIYKNGSMGLQNCAFLNITDDIGSCAHWAMDALMCGVGVGFRPIREEIVINKGLGKVHIDIKDSREGWVDSVKSLIDHYIYGEPEPIYNYDLIRKQGLPIRGFGGYSSGPEPLKELHGELRKFFEWYAQGFVTDSEILYDIIMLKTDIMNAIGCCVIAGNVRRSAEIACGEINDPVFIDLKDYDKYAYREAHGYMSNNSVYLRESDDFNMLGQIARRVTKNGEPGVINYKNLKHGRLGKYKDKVRVDKADGFNPCGEQPLYDRECCTLVETAPTRCKTVGRWYRACEYATFYAQTVTLLPSHRQETNKVMSMNRRIGVGIIGYTEWVDNEQQNNVIKYLRTGYDLITKYAEQFANDAGVATPIRHTTMKPGGTVPKIIGAISGAAYANFNYMIRRIRQNINSPMTKLLIDAGVPYEKSVNEKDTYVFELPLYQPGKKASEVSLWEQMANVITLQAEWSDNAVSNTINFKPAWPVVERLTIGDFGKYTTVDEATEYLTNKYGVDFNYGLSYSDTYSFKDLKIALKTEWGKPVVYLYKYDPTHEEDDIEKALSFAVPRIKSLSLLPHTSLGVYEQMPEQEITREEYNERLKALSSIDWDKLRNAEANNADKFCTSDNCEIPVNAN